MQEKPGIKIDEFLLKFALKQGKGIEDAVFVYTDIIDSMDAGEEEEEKEGEEDELFQ